MKAECPKNHEHKMFITSATVVEDWIVDEYGHFVKLAEYYGPIVTHFPNPDNLWICEECGAEATVER